jgi:hypothetical protein
MVESAGPINEPTNSARYNACELDNDVEDASVALSPVLRHIPEGASSQSFTFKQNN